MKKVWLLLLLLLLLGLAGGAVAFYVWEEENFEESFDGTVLVTRDVRIEIMDARIIPPGEPGNKKGQMPVLAIWYDTTNRTRRYVHPDTAWDDLVDAFQVSDEDGDLKNLKLGPPPDEALIGSQFIILKVGKKVSAAVAYVMTSETADVTLKAVSRSGEELGERTYHLADVPVQTARSLRERNPDAQGESTPR